MNFEVMFWQQETLFNGIDAMAAMHAGYDVVRVIRRRSLPVDERVERLETLIEGESVSLENYFSGRKPYAHAENYSGLYAYYVVQFGNLMLAAIRTGDVYIPPSYKPPKRGLFGRSG